MSANKFKALSACQTKILYCLIFVLRPYIIKQQLIININIINTDLSNDIKLKMLLIDYSLDFYVFFG